MNVFMNSEYVKYGRITMSIEEVEYTCSGDDHIVWNNRLGSLG
jgi:hypothetical protein